MTRVGRIKFPKVSKIFIQKKNIKFINIEDGTLLKSIPLSASYTGGNKDASLIKVLENLTLQVRWKLKNLYMINSEIIEVNKYNITMMSGNNLGLKDGTIFEISSIDKIKLINNAYETENIAKSKKNNDGIYIVPAFTGLGAPYWNPDARGIITGLTRNTDWKNLVRAVIESVAYQSYDLFDAMRKDGSRPKIIKVDGGMVANNWFAQFLSDVLNTKVLRPMIEETTALGVAFFAGYQAGEFKSFKEIKNKWKKDAIFVPKINKKLRNNLLQGWQQAIRKTLA